VVNGVRMITAVMGEPSRNAVNVDTMKLFHYGATQYREALLGEKGTEMADVAVPNTLGETMTLVTDSPVSGYVLWGDATSTAVQVDPRWTFPVSAGTVMGTVTYKVGGKAVGKANLVTVRPVAVLERQGREMTTVPLPYNEAGTLALVTDRTVASSLAEGVTAKAIVSVTKPVTLPVEKGAVFGKVTYQVAGTTVGEADLVAARAVPAPTLGQKFSAYWGDFVRWLKSVL
jgi:D-alanyl-D-alanine carboxypeptidase